MQKNKQIGDILLELGFITPEQIQAALLHQKQNEPHRKIGEILVDLGFINEVDLLKCLAGLFRIRYISSEKLAKVVIAPWIIQMVPVEFADRYNVLPILCDTKNRIISVVISEPQSTRIPEMIREITGYTEVRTYLGLPSTIKAAIAKHYRNDQNAFARLRLGEARGGADALGGFAPEAQQMPGREYDGSETVLNLRQTAETSLPPAVERRATVAASGDPQRRLADHISAHSLMSENTFIEVLNIVINVLELYKGDSYKGHSATVAKLVKNMAAVSGLKARDTYYHVLAAFLHDCCMNSPEHLTLWSYDRNESLKMLKKFCRASVRLFEKTRLPPQVPELLARVFERYDGKGLPDGLVGKRIPPGAQMIAIADAFIQRRGEEEDRGSRNPTKEAFNAIRARVNELFDPDVVEVLEQVLAEHLLDENSPRLLLVDRNPDELAALAARLKQKGIVTATASNSVEAQAKLAERPFHLVVSEVDLGPEDGFALCRAIKADPKLAATGFVFLSARTDSSTVNGGFAAGAVDFLTKPYTIDVVVAKIRQYLRQAADRAEAGRSRQAAPNRKGVAGSLGELHIADMVQLFAGGRKTGALKLTRGEEEGAIYFDSGQVVNARYGDLEGTDAFNLLVRWEDGHFSLDPDAELPPAAIEGSAEGLLMEAYRLWDEERHAEGEGGEEADGADSAAEDALVDSISEGLPSDGNDQDDPERPA